jgi:hypothetical protein
MRGVGLKWRCVLFWYILSCFDPFVITTGILDRRNGHSMRPNMVAFKYHDFKKNANPNVHVNVFNSTIKANAKTSKSISSMRLAIG